MIKPMHPDLKGSEVIFAFHHNRRQSLFFPNFPVPDDKKRILPGVHVGNSTLSDWWTLAVDVSELSRLAAFPTPLLPMTEWPKNNELRDALKGIGIILDEDKEEDEPVQPIHVVSAQATETKIPVVANGHDSLPAIKKKRGLRGPYKKTLARLATLGTTPRPASDEEPEEDSSTREIPPEILEKGPRKKRGKGKKTLEREAAAQRLADGPAIRRERWIPTDPTDEVLMVISPDCQYLLRDTRYPRERDSDHSFGSGEYRMELVLCPQTPNKWFPNGSPWYVIKRSNFGLPIGLMQILSRMTQDGINEDILFYEILPAKS